MATHMIKVLYEGEIAKASRNADPGVTSGGAAIFEITGVPDAVPVDDVIAAMRRLKGKPRHRDYEVLWKDLAA